MTFLFAFIIGIYVGTPHYHSVGPERSRLGSVQISRPPIVGIPVFRQ